MKKNIEDIVDNHLKNENIDNKKKDKEIEKLEYNLNELKEKIEYNDANLKANYILPLLVINYLFLAILFHFENFLKINNYFSAVIVAIVLALFFYKENQLIAKKILKKIFLKGDI